MTLNKIDTAMNVVYTAIGTVATADNLSGARFLQTLGYGALKKYALPTVYFGAWSTVPGIFLSKQARKGDNSWAANMIASLGYRSMFSVVTMLTVQDSAEDEKTGIDYVTGFVIAAVVVKGVVYYVTRPKPVTTVGGPAHIPLGQIDDEEAISQTKRGEGDKMPLIDDGKGVSINDLK